MAPVVDLLLQELRSGRAGSSTSVNLERVTIRNGIFSDKMHPLLQAVSDFVFFFLASSQTKVHADSLGKGATI
jgi:hypothetical protein